MILFPPAKINLGLNVKFKRDDGFHELQTCMYPIPLHDVLEILPAESDSFTQSGLLIDSSSDDNLVVRAYNLMKANFDFPPTAIHLQKNIPMGAGLGGGSADATYVLRGLNELYKLNIVDSTIASLSNKLGSDCAFFAYDNAMLATGRGEELSPIRLDLGGLYLKLVNLGVHISTGEAYGNVSFIEEEQHLWNDLLAPIANWKETIFNSFEKSAFKLHPEIEEVKDDLYKEGAVYASMSGSGSSVFGLFEKEPLLSHQNYFEKIIQL